MTTADNGQEILEAMMAAAPVPAADIRYRIRAADEVRSEASAFIREQAMLLISKAHVEGIKGAANTALVTSYRWAAEFLGEMAKIVDSIALEVEDTTPALPPEPEPEPDPNRLSPAGASEPNPRVLVDRVAATMETVDSPYGDGASLDEGLSKPATEDDTTEDDTDEESSDPATVSTEPAKRGRGRPPKVVS